MGERIYQETLIAKSKRMLVKALLQTILNPAVFTKQLGRKGWGQTIHIFVVSQAG